MKVQNKQDEKAVIINGLQRYGRRAYEKALAGGISVTVLRGNDICRVAPDGSRVVVVADRNHIHPKFL